MSCSKHTLPTDPLKMFAMLTRPEVCVELTCSKGGGKKKIIHKTSGRKRVIHKGGGKIWNRIKKFCGLQTTTITPLQVPPVPFPITREAFHVPPVAFPTSRVVPLASPIYIQTYTQYQPLEPVPKDQRYVLPGAIAHEPQLIVRKLPPLKPSRPTTTTFSKQPLPPLRTPENEIQSNLSNLPNDLVSRILHDVYNANSGLHIHDVQAIALSCKALNDAASGDVLLYTKEFFIHTLGNIIGSVDVREDEPYSFNLLFKTDVNEAVLSCITISFEIKLNLGRLKHNIEAKDDEEGYNSDNYSSDTRFESLETIVTLTYGEHTKTIPEFDAGEYNIIAATTILEWIGKPTRLLVLDVDVYSFDEIEKVDIISQPIENDTYIKLVSDFKESRDKLDKLHTCQYILKKFLNMVTVYVNESILDHDRKKMERLQNLAIQQPEIYQQIFVLYKQYYAAEYFDARKGHDTYASYDRNLQKAFFDLIGMYGPQQNLKDIIKPMKELHDLLETKQKTPKEETKYVRDMVKQCITPPTNDLNTEILILIEAETLKVADTKDYIHKQLYAMQKDNYLKRIQGLTKQRLTKQRLTKQGGANVLKRTPEKFQIDKNTTRNIYTGRRNTKYVKLHGEFVTLTSLKKKLKNKIKSSK